MPSLLIVEIDIIAAVLELVYGAVYEQRQVKRIHGPSCTLVKGQRLRKSAKSVAGFPCRKI